MNASAVEKADKARKIQTGGVEGMDVAERMKTPLEMRQGRV
jgi:hypothetical protein